MRTLFVRIAISVGAVAPALACLDCRTGPEPLAAPDASPPVTGSAAATASAPRATPAASSAAAAFPVPSSSVDQVLNPAGLPAYDGPTGSVEGTVTVQGPRAPDVTVDASKCPAALDTYGKLFREGVPAAPNGPRAIADAVVVITGYAGFYLKEKSEAVHLTIGANCAYSSRTVAITYGQRLDISNQTGLLFAPAIQEATVTAIMVAPPHETGEPVRIYPTMAGYFGLFDRMEPYVHEDLYVFRHPLHAVTNRGGYYRIDGLPVGKVKVGVHHPAINADAEAPVDVVAGAVQKVDLVLTYKPKPPQKILDAGLPPARLRLD
jgi:hypothetical protein